MVRNSNGRSIQTRTSAAARRADARRIAILRAASGVFRRRGFAAAGMREIAVAADLSPANLYHYFRGKNELLFFCQDRALDRLTAALATARRSSDPIADRVHALARAHVLCLVDEVDGSAAHIEIDALPSTLRTAIVAKRDRYERGVRRLVAAGIASGALRHDDPDVATRAFLGALNWTARWFRPDGAQSPERLAELVADYAVAGLGASTVGTNERSQDVDPAPGRKPSARLPSRSSTPAATSWSRRESSGTRAAASRAPHALRRS